MRSWREWGAIVIDEVFQSSTPFGFKDQDTNLEQNVSWMGRPVQLINHRKLDPTISCSLLFGSLALEALLIGVH